MELVFIIGFQLSLEQQNEYWLGPCLVWNHHVYFGWTILALLYVMSYILVEIPSDGMIRSESIDPSQLNYTYRGESPGEKKIVHKESLSIDKWDGVRVFNNLETAKTYWSGPESDEAILNLDGEGAAANIWVAEAQAERLTGRLKRWSGCYGGIAVKQLNS